MGNTEISIVTNLRYELSLHSQNSSCMARNTGYEYKQNIPRLQQTSFATIEFGNLEECGRRQKQE